MPIRNSTPTAQTCYRGYDGTSKLYDLATGIGETTDLAARFPGKMAELQAAHMEWEQGVIEPGRWEGFPIVGL